MSRDKCVYVHTLACMFRLPRRCAWPPLRVVLTVMGEDVKRDRRRRHEIPPAWLLRHLAELRLII